MDFRKYDGFIGGVEQGIIQITKRATAKGHYIIMLCKKRSLQKTKELFNGVANLKIIPLDVENHSISDKNALLDSTVIPDIAKEEGAGVIHFPYNISFPSKKKVPTILTVHDVIPFTFREAMDIHTHKYLYKSGIKKACMLNDVIVTVSNFSKRDISEKAGVPIDKIRVIPNGLRKPSELNKTLEATLIKKFRLSQGCVLNVGGIHERKNIVRLIHAFKKFIEKSGFKGKLLITGSVSGAPYQDEMKKMCDKTISETGMEERIVFTGFVTDDELDTLFKITEFLIYPSLYEGFGIPILEAMQAGTPVITSNVTAMPEIANDAAILIDPENVEDMASAMIRLLKDSSLRKKLIEKGKKRAVAYSWERTVNEYLAIYKEVYRE